MIKSKKQLFIVVGVFALILMLFTTTYAFFNYTRTGSSNTIRVGRISFVSENEEIITLNNLFPIDPSNTTDMNDPDKVGTYSIDIVGDTDYVDGVEYLVSVVDSSITTTLGQTVPISLDITVSNGLGASSDSYWIVRESKNATIYKQIVGETLEGNGMLLVGYIKPNTTSGTADGVNGSITIKAYLDKNKIAISDTYNGEETDNMGTTSNWANDRVVLTAAEWNALQQSGVSFKVKVEANEGIWVEEPIKAYDKIIENVITPTNPVNFANVSDSSNGEGLYILPGTENNTNPIYYYRGAIDNNNVIFGDYCWKMVRTTDTGGIKMIYNGEPTINSSGNNISYDCGITREFQDDIITKTNLSQSTGYYYADDYEIVSSNRNEVTYRLKSKTNPITQVAITNTSAASEKIPTIVANYPYTCKQTTDTGTCTTLYKVDSYDSYTGANVYESTYISTIGSSVFSSQNQSVADVGYMKNNNARYAYQTKAPVSGAYFGTSVEYGEYDINNPGTNVYRLVDDENGSVGTTLDATHHYSCDLTTATGTCTTIRYYYYASGTMYKYINLTGGEKVEDALYKMTGYILNQNIDVVTRNQGYVLNNTDSTIKTAIEGWFRTNLTNEVDAGKRNYADYLEDTIYCNDRSLKTVAGNLSFYNVIYEESGWNPNGGNRLNSLFYGTANRYYDSWYSTTNVPSVACPNETDRFSVSSSVAHLNYPVGLLTADEMIMAGAAGSYNSVVFNNKSYYLYTGNYYWTLSPYSFSTGGAAMLGVNNKGLLESSTVNSYYGLRPVVSLKPKIEFESGGDGTPTNPYIVKYE